MKIDSINNGIVIDHIKAGRGMDLYRLLKLEGMDCSVALIRNAPSKKMGRKDIIKIDANLDIDYNTLGYIDPGITINIIENGTKVEKLHPELPERMTNIIFCKNPRCITTTEQELPHVFKLIDRSKGTYRCIYCESQAK